MSATVQELKYFIQFLIIFTLAIDLSLLSIFDWLLV